MIDPCEIDRGRSNLEAVKHLAQRVLVHKIQSISCELTDRLHSTTDIRRLGSRIPFPGVLCW